MSHKTLTEKWRLFSGNISSYIFGLTTSVSLFLFGGHSTSIDEESYLAGLRGFLHGRSTVDTNNVNLNGILSMPGKSGGPAIFYGFGTTLFNLPGYLLGKTFSLPFSPMHQEQIVRLFLFSTNSIALGFTSVIIYKSCMTLGCSLRISIWASTSFALCTFALNSAGTGFSEPLTAMFLVLAFYLSLNDSWKSTLLCGLALGSAILMRSSALLFLPVFMIYFSMKRDLRAIFRNLMLFGSGGVIPGAIFLSVNLWKFGGPLNTGYPTLKYNTPILEGVFGLLASSGKGIFWFAPISLIAIGTLCKSVVRARGASVFLVTLIVANLLFFARFEIWSGDDAFGPRYMGIVLPLISILAAIGSFELSSRTRWASSIAGLPASIGGSLIYVNAENVRRGKEILAIAGKSAFTSDGLYDGNAIRRFTNFQPRLSQLSAHFTDAVRSLGHIFEMFSNRSNVNPFADGITSSLSWYSSHINVDTWWYYWIVTGAPRIFLLGIPFLVLSMFWCVRELLNAVKTDESR